jgi:hypothetical protein
MTTFASIRRQLEQARAAIPEPHAKRGFNSEEMFREVQRLLAEVEANPSTEPQPFNPADYLPEDAALILKVERMQSEILANEVTS